MKEHQMRQVVKDVLRSTVRRVVLPASLGLGLALGGCGSRAIPSDATTDGQQQEDTGAIGTKYGAPFPKQDGLMAPLYGAVFPDAGIGGRYGAPFPSDAG